jgi:rhodanese-related sulfurtransferase
MKFSFTAILLFLSYSFLFANNIPFTTGNIMKNTKNNIIKISNIELTSSQQVDKILKKSINDVAIMSFHRGCKNSSIKNAKCLNSPNYKQIAKEIEKNPNKKHYILVCNSGKQSLIFTSLFKLSGVDIPSILPVSWKDYKKNGKFIEVKNK